MKIAINVDDNLFAWHLTQISKFFLPSTSTSFKVNEYGVYMIRFSETRVVHVPEFYILKRMYVNMRRVLSGIWHFINIFFNTDEDSIQCYLLAAPFVPAACCGLEWVKSKMWQLVSQFEPIRNLFLEFWLCFWKTFYVHTINVNLASLSYHWQKEFLNLRHFACR